MREPAAGSRARFVPAGPLPCRHPERRPTLRLHRLALLAAAPQALAALLGSAAPAHAGWNNTIMTNALSANALATTS